MGSQLPIFVDCRLATPQKAQRGHTFLPRGADKLENDRRPFKGGFQVAFRIANNGGETETYSDNMNARNCWIVR